jgi:hypothetical protein
LANIGGAQWIDNDRFLVTESTGEGSGLDVRMMISLWSIDGTLLERWIPPIDLLRFPVVTPIAIHLG